CWACIAAEFSSHERSECKPARAQPSGDARSECKPARAQPSRDARSECKPARAQPSRDARSECKPARRSHQEMTHWLGIDVGTGGTRALLADSKGKVRHAFTSAHEEMRMERPLWAEQRPENWWDAAQHAIR